MQALPALSFLLSLTFQEPAVPDPEPAVIAALRRLSTTAPVVVAHRGESATCPENTVPAFERALELGAGMVEFDVRQTADGELVCIHDATADRTTDAERVLGRSEVPVAQLDLETLKTLDAGAFKDPRFAGTRIPTLQEGLQTIAKGAIPMIEHKDGDPERYVALIRRLRMEDRVLLQSFDWEFVAAVHRLEPRIALGVLGPPRQTRKPVTDLLDRIPATGARLVHWGARDLRVEDVAALHERGYLVCTYTTDDDAGLIGLSAMGVDAVTSNRPGRLRELIQAGFARRREKR